MTYSRHIPSIVSASLSARLAPFSSVVCGATLEDLDVETSRAVAPHHEPARNATRTRFRLISDLKLLFAALGAGGSAVPLGDNGRAARLLAEYAASLKND